MESFSDADATLNDMEVLKQQLTTYKAINVDLSKKVNDLKTQVNVAEKEIVYLKKELFEEKEKSSGIRRLLSSINSNCVQFMNSYISQMQNAAQSLDLNLSIPRAQQQQQEEGASSQQRMISGKLLW